MAAVALIANSRSPGKPALPTTKTKHGAMPQFGSASHHTDLRSSDLHSCWPGLEFAQKMHSSKTRFGNRSRRVPKNKRSRLPGYLKRAGRLSGLDRHLIIPICAHLTCIVVGRDSSSLRKCIRVRLDSATDHVVSPRTSDLVSLDTSRGQVGCLVWRANCPLETRIGSLICSDSTVQNRSGREPWHS